jgi:probable HAF family extracellular repeat protein
VGTKDLGTLGGYNSEASGINSSGHVVGWSEVKNFGRNRPFLFRDDIGMVDLQSAIVSPPAGFTALKGVRRINDAGQICGTATLTDGYGNEYSEACLLTPVP